MYQYKSIYMYSIFRTILEVHKNVMYQYKSIYMYSIFRTILGVHKNVMYQYKSIYTCTLYLELYCEYTRINVPVQEYIYMHSIFRTILGVHKNVMYQYKNILHSLFARILCLHGLQVKYIICLFRHLYLFYLTVYLFICKFAYTYLFICRFAYIYIYISVYLLVFFYFIKQFNTYLLCCSIL